MFGTLILCNNDLNREHVKEKLKERKIKASLEEKYHVNHLKDVDNNLKKNEKRVKAEDSAKTFDQDMQKEMCLKNK